MQSTPSETGRAASRRGSRTDPRGLLGADPPDDTVLPARERPSTPTVVLRARRQWRLPVLVVAVVAAVLVVSGRWWGIGVLVLAIPFVPAWWIRVEMNAWTVRRRDWRRRWSSLDLDAVDGLRLRRLPFAALRWLPRGYRVGRFWSVPLTLRLQYGDEVMFEIRCAWWDGWRDVAAYVAALPDMGLDARTRGRLGRYVGPITFATSDQP